MKQIIEIVFRTAELSLAAFLALHFTNYWLDKQDPTRVIFVFDRSKDTELFDDMVQAFWTGAPEALVHPLKYFESLKRLKSRIYGE